MTILNAHGKLNHIRSQSLVQGFNKWLTFLGVEMPAMVIFYHAIGQSENITAQGKI